MLQYSILNGVILKKQLRSTVFLILAAFVVIFSGCGHNKPEAPRAPEAVDELSDFSKPELKNNENSTSLSNINNLGIWEIKYFVDEFKEPTKNRFITTTKPIYGTYSSYYVQNSKFVVGFFISKTIDIMLLDYYDYAPKKRDGKISYSLLVKDSKGKIYTFSAYHNYDRLSFSSNKEELKMFDILSEGGTVKFRIKGSEQTEYNFTIDNADGFRNACIALNGNSEKQTKNSEYNDGLRKDELPVGFLEFLNKFTSSRETQLSLLYKPLLYIKYSDEDYEAEKEYWDEKKLVKDWFFMKADNFIFGEIDNYYVGEWKIENNSVVYRYGIVESSILFILTFKKVDGNWCLFSYDDISTTGL